MQVVQLVTTVLSLVACMLSTALGSTSLSKVSLVSTAIFDVTKYGAKGNGITDDSPVIIRTITSVSLPPAKIFNSQKRRRVKPTPPIFISTKLSDVNPIELRELYSSCNHSCYRFPNISSDGHVEPVDVDKLRVAICHSSVVVSVFARPEFDDWYRRMIPLTPFSGELVGFGRAVSDLGLTASIYDVMVIPSLRGRGIGRMILQRIIRLLTNKGIYDIAALCSDQEMDFFKRCGFGDDILGSTTMMYTSSGNDMVKTAGRKLLMVPPLRKL